MTRTGFCRHINRCLCYFSLEVSSTNSPSTSFGRCAAIFVKRSLTCRSLLLVLFFAANFDQFNANTQNEEMDQPPSEAAAPSPPVPFVPVATSPIQAVDVDPFQTVDPFASQPALGTTPSNNDWFQPSHQEISPNTVDPFLPTVEPTVVTSAAVSPRIKKAAPKAHPNSKGAIRHFLFTEPLLSSIQIRQNQWPMQTHGVHLQTPIMDTIGHNFKTRTRAHRLATRQNGHSKPLFPMRVHRMVRAWFHVTSSLMSLSL